MNGERLTGNPRFALHIGGRFNPGSPRDCFGA